MALKLTDLPRPPIIANKPLRRRRLYRVAEWLKLPEHPKTELIGGLIQRMPPPNYNHEEIILNIAELLRPFVRANQAGRVTTTATLPDGLEGEDGWIPDLMFVSNNNALKIGDYVNGLPDWVLEVWAGKKNRPGRIKEKRERWQQAGVPEMWEVILHDGQTLVNVYRLDENQIYQIVPQTDDKICSEVIAGFCIERAAIFANLVGE